jgi:hypothetical protein
MMSILMLAHMATVSLMRWWRGIMVRRRGRSDSGVMDWGCGVGGGSCGWIVKFRLEMVGRQGFCDCLFVLL